MANSKCSKCENTSFEVKANSPSGSNFKLLFIQCQNCGSVVGTMDYYNIGARLGDLEKKIDAININSINTNLSIINQNITNALNYIKNSLHIIVANIDKKAVNKDL